MALEMSKLQFEGPPCVRASRSAVRVSFGTARRVPSSPSKWINFANGRKRQTMREIMHYEQRPATLSPGWQGWKQTWLRSLANWRARKLLTQAGRLETEARALHDAALEALKQAHAIAPWIFEGPAK